MVPRQPRRHYRRRRAGPLPRRHSRGHARSEYRCGAGYELPTALASSADAAKATIEAVRRPEAWLDKSRSWRAGSSEARSEEVKPLFAKPKSRTSITPAEAVRGHHAARALCVGAGGVDADAACHCRQKHFDLRRRGGPHRAHPQARAAADDGTGSQGRAEAYGIPTVPTQVAATPEEAARAAAELLRGYASLVVKILSPDITHKSDIGGVRLDLTSAGGGGESHAPDAERDQSARPDAIIEGVTVQPMITARTLLSSSLASRPTTLRAGHPVWRGRNRRGGHWR